MSVDAPLLFGSPSNPISLEISQGIACSTAGPYVGSNGAWYWILQQQSSTDHDSRFAAWKSTDRGATRTLIATSDEIATQRQSQKERLYYRGSGDIIDMVYQFSTAIAVGNLFTMTFDMSSEAFSAASDTGVNRISNQNPQNYGIGINEDGNQVVVYDRQDVAGVFGQVFAVVKSAGVWSSPFIVSTVMQDAFTDLVIDGALNTKVTSASVTFTSNFVNSYLEITGGTGFTPGIYQISSVSGGAAILSSPAGTVGSTGGHFNVTTKLASFDELMQDSTGHLGVLISDDNIAASTLLASQVYIRNNFYWVRLTGAAVASTTTAIANAGGANDAAPPFVPTYGADTGYSDGNIKPPIYDAASNSIVIPMFKETWQSGGGGPQVLTQEIGVLVGTPSAAPVWTYHTVYADPVSPPVDTWSYPVIAGKSNGSEFSILFAIDRDVGDTTLARSIGTSLTGTWTTDTAWYDVTTNPPTPEPDFNSILFFNWARYVEAAQLFAASTTFEYIASPGGYTSDMAAFFVPAALPSTLELTKIVEGGPAVPGSFTLSAVGGTDTISGNGHVGPTEVTPDTYELSEVILSGATWDADSGTWSSDDSTWDGNYIPGPWNCGDAEMPTPTSVVVPPGGVVACTIQNTFEGPSPPPPPPVPPGTDAVGCFELLRLDVTLMPARHLPTRGSVK